MTRRATASNLHAIWWEHCIRYFQHVVPMLKYIDLYRTQFVIPDRWPSLCLALTQLSLCKKFTPYSYQMEGEGRNLCFTRQLWEIMFYMFFRNKTVQQSKMVRVLDHTLIHAPCGYCAPVTSKLVDPLSWSTSESKQSTWVTSWPSWCCKRFACSP